MGKLILIRHGASQWNEEGLWTGKTDVPLSEKGRQEAREAGQKIIGISIDKAYTSTLIRAVQTLDEIKKEIPNASFSLEESSALNERDYGIYTGKNKWEIRKEIGEEAFGKLRRGWNTPIPDGESLKDVYERVIPFFEFHILPDLKKGKTILISAHGNSLRALVKHLDQISDTEIEKLEIPTGQVIAYDFDANGELKNKSIL